MDTQRGGNAKHRPREPRDRDDRLLRRAPARHFDAASALLDPDVTWQGLREDWVCHGPEEVIQTFRWGLEQRREIDAFKFSRRGDQVVMGARGPAITEVAGEPLEIDDYRRRVEALA